MSEEFAQRLQRIEEALYAALLEYIDQDWVNLSFSDIPEAVLPRHILPLLKPCKDLVLRGGKRWRPLVAVLSAELACGDAYRAYALTPVIEFIHTASLIHDDIEDSAETRRGAPAIHIQYGTDTAINAASWLYFHAMSIINAYPSSSELKLSLYRTVNKNLTNLHLGQAMDIDWHRNSNFIPSRAEYMAMIALKTGSLARLAAEIGFLAGGAGEEATEQYGKTMESIGIGFQILDDAKNITGGNKGKNIGDDIVEGKKSFPVIFHLEEHPEDLQKIQSYFETAKKEGIESQAIRECIELLNSSKAAERAKNYGIQMIEASVLQLCGHFPAKPAAKLIADLFHSME
ncbi:polyprenyl synthetase family protein [Treponema phagedenis]|uniref:polyprenyl synthetase family protein n=1 Tax=Treponema phagedenis TaxID=162 RepID=UPI0011E6AE1F|nr:polyprenyl synthetase family protein [Treponema phagedenis]QEJ95519.1 polyprenyl synthetase family protein [Treponema phagedenis]